MIVNVRVRHGVDDNQYNNSGIIKVMKLTLKKCRSETIS